MDHVPRLLVINGPNINLLGMREPGIYGTQTYQDLLDSVAAAAAEAGVEVTCFQSNHEGAIVDAIQEARGAIDGILLSSIPRPIRIRASRSSTPSRPCPSPSWRYIFPTSHRAKASVRSLTYGRTPR